MLIKSITSGYHGALLSCCAICIVSSDDIVYCSARVWDWIEFDGSGGWSISSKE